MDYSKFEVSVIRARFYAQRSMMVYEYHLNAYKTVHIIFGIVIVTLAAVSAVNINLQTGSYSVWKWINVFIPLWVTAAAPLLSKFTMRERLEIEVCRWRDLYFKYGKILDDLALSDDFTKHIEQFDQVRKLDLDAATDGPRVHLIGFISGLAESQCSKINGIVKKTAAPSAG